MRLTPYQDVLPAASQIAAAARDLGADPAAAVLAFHPTARLNHYQGLLYSAASASGFRTVGIPKMEDLESLESAVALGAKGVVHLHWTNKVLEGAKDPRAALDAFAETIDGWHERDLALVWTVHNRLPHNCSDPESEIALRRLLAEKADAIHIMNPRTPDIVGDLYELPSDRLFQTPHPSYVGAYPTYFDPVTTRLELGLSAGQTVVGLIGSIQPYKGVDEILDVAEHLVSSDPRSRIIVAGIPGGDPASQDLLQRLQSSRVVSSLAAKLDDRNLARLIIACDVVVLPYRASLNSGAALLALTFGRPIIAPNDGPFEELIQRGIALGYDRETPGALLEALVSASDFVRSVGREVISAYVDEVAPAKVSPRFFAGLRETLGW